MRHDSLRRHELHDDAGNLLLVLDLVDGSPAEQAAGMIELAADIGSRSVRVRVYPRAAEARRAA